MLLERKVQRDWPTCLNPLVRFQWVSTGSHFQECLQAHYSPSIERAILSAQITKAVGLVRVIENAWKNRVIAAPLPSDGKRQLGSCGVSSSFFSVAKKVLGIWWWPAVLKTKIKNLQTGAT